MKRRSQLKAMRSQAREARARLRAQVKAHPLVQKARRRRRVRRAVMTAILLLLLLLIRCDCGAPPVVETKSVDAGVDAGARVMLTPPKKSRREAISAVKHQRSPWETDTRPGPAWLESFRMQVAARSPRLAECFSGSERPGALRWGVAVNPVQGTVSDHSFEPLGAAEITQAQRECLTRVLSSPRYQVAAEEVAGVPPQVTLTLEF